MDPTEALIMHPAVTWVTENPTLVVILAMIVPSLIALLAERLLGRRTLEPESEAVAAPEPAATSPVESQPVPIAEPVVAEQPASEPEPEPEPEPKPEPTEAAAPRRVPLRERLARTSDTLVGRLNGLLGGRKVDAALLEELEMMLFTADLGVRTAESLLDTVRQKASGGDASEVTKVLRAAIFEKLARVQPQGEPLATAGRPHVVLVVGVNGSGKTTSIGKLAARYAQSGKKVVLGAGDTFRAAAVEQLQVWGDRVGCDVISTRAGGDPAAVAFDTVKAAIAREADVAIVDTAGRLQTKKPLMEELGKIVRVLSRDIPEAPHETLLVLDSNTGQNAISQARLFTEVTDITGLVLTKLDGSAKGGVIIGLADEFGIPVHYVGVGEGVEDLRDFDAREFVDALFNES
ncbi:MAG: signal recognition particle-docking protein FtsY [Deltaproteobacteria bacterium]|nr:signal recognition particle-docking protein FtsY [Deltaproteobacteria bacterium]